MGGNLTYTVGSLFSGGCDGFALAAEAAGMQVLWHIEREQKRRKYLKQNFNAKIYHDIRYCGNHKPQRLQAVEIMAGGDPCQPHSLAGQRRGTADDRYLWPDYFRLIKELNPRWVINENVAGTISNMVLGSKIADLESAGYATTAVVLPACGVGAPHQRDRVFLIAHNGEPRGTQSHKVAESEHPKHSQFEQHGHTGKVDYQNRYSPFFTDPTQNQNNKREAADISKKKTGQKSKHTTIGNGSTVLANHLQTKCEAWWHSSGYQQAPQLGRFTWWQIEPPVDRVVHGFPHRVEQLEALGDAVVPQLPFVIFQLIKHTDKIYYNP